MEPQYLQREIMEQSRHLFVYGYSNKERNEFLKEMVKNYPICFNSNKPIAIYCKNIGLPKMIASGDVDSITISVFHREYCYYELASIMINQLLQSVDSSVLKQYSTAFINRINKLFLEKENQIGNIEQLKELIEEAKQSYLSGYQDYMNNGILKVPYNRFSYFSFEIFLNYFKRMLNLQSYFGMIMDYQGVVSIESQKVINNFTSSRSNKDISMKIVCEPETWRTFYSQNGEVVEAIHDYGTVELDDSFKKYLDDKKEKCKIKIGEWYENN